MQNSCCNPPVHKQRSHVLPPWCRPPYHTQLPCALPYELPPPRQAYISRSRVESFSLTADMMYVASNAPRIARALFEIVARRKWNSAADLLLTLCKVIPGCRGGGARSGLH